MTQAVAGRMAKEYNTSQPEPPKQVQGTFITFYRTYYSQIHKNFGLTSKSMVNPRQIQFLESHFLMLKKPAKLDHGIAESFWVGTYERFVRILKLKSAGFHVHLVSISSQFADGMPFP
jgi:hypothetical protein